MNKKELKDKQALTDEEIKNKLPNCGFTCVIYAMDKNKTTNADEIYEYSIQILKEMLEQDYTRHLVVKMCQIVVSIGGNINAGAMFKDNDDIDTRLLKRTKLYYRLCKLMELINSWRREKNISRDNNFIRSNMDFDDLEERLVSINRKIMEEIYFCESAKGELIQESEENTDGKM